MALLLLRGRPRYALDSQPAAFAAYSLRRLSTAYAGPLVNIRRSSDSTTQDFSATSRGALNTQAVADFIGAGSGFVAKWYDQSGNARDAAQATTANQPQLVLQRSTLKNRPALLYGDATSFSLATGSTASSIFGAGGFYSSVVDFTTTPTVSGRFFEHSINFNLTTTNALQLLQPATGSATWTDGTALAKGGHVVGLLYSSAALANVPTITVDGAARTLSVLTQPTGTITAESGALTVGNFTTLARAFPGYMGEDIFFATQPSAAQLAALRANQKSYWGTP